MLMKVKNKNIVLLIKKFLIKSIKPLQYSLAFSLYLHDMLLIIKSFPAWVAHSVSVVISMNHAVNWICKRKHVSPQIAKRVYLIRVVNLCKIKYMYVTKINSNHWIAN